MMFSAFIRIFAGRLSTDRNTGHKFHDDDLKRGTPSVFNDSPMWFLQEKSLPVTDDEALVHPTHHIRTVIALQPVHVTSPNCL